MWYLFPDNDTNYFFSCATYFLDTHGDEKLVFNLEQTYPCDTSHTSTEANRKIKQFSLCMLFYLYLYITHIHRDIAAIYLSFYLSMYLSTERQRQTVRSNSSLSLCLSICLSVSLYLCVSLPHTHPQGDRGRP